jgi:hypothetical protein
MIHVDKCWEAPVKVCAGLKGKPDDVDKMFSNADFAVQLFFIYSIFESKNCTLYNVKISRTWVHNSSLLDWSKDSHRDQFKICEFNVDCSLKY